MRECIILYFIIALGLLASVIVHCRVNNEARYSFAMFGQTKSGFLLLICNILWPISLITIIIYHLSELIGKLAGVPKLHG